MARRRGQTSGSGGATLFGIATARDFYAMAVQDFDDFMEEPHSARRAIHCAISAYHLHDWVWGERLAHDPTFRASLGCGDRKDDFVNWLCRMIWHFGTVQEIATGSKHFRPSTGLEAVKVQAPPFMFGTLGAGWGEGAWDGPIHYTSGTSDRESEGRGYLLIDLGPGDEVHRYQPAVHVLEAVVRFWRNFFRAYDVGGDPVQCSPHHID